MEKVVEIPLCAQMKIVLTSFFGARVDDVMNENGDMEKCVCIPLDRNDLHVGNTGKVSAYAFVNKTRNANRFGWTHYLKLKMSPSFVERMKGLGYEIPYIGNMKPANYITNRHSYKDSLEKEKVKIKDYE